MSWYVVYTRPKAEGVALWHLQNQGFQCFLPQLRTIHRHARQVRIVSVPLFPRYFFICFDKDLTAWRSINGTRGVIGVLAEGVSPVPVRSAIIEGLMSQIDSTGCVPVTALGLFSEGAKVRIISGPFKGQVGEFGGVADRDRVRVLLNLLGVQTHLETDQQTIEAA